MIRMRMAIQKRDQGALSRCLVEGLLGQMGTAADIEQMGFEVMETMDHDTRHWWLCEPCDCGQVFRH